MLAAGILLVFLVPEGAGVWGPGSASPAGGQPPST